MNNTPFTKIYEKFLLKIKDWDINEYAEDDKYYFLFNYLENACGDFEPECRQSLDFEEGEQDNIFYKSGKFRTALTIREINILSKLMVQHWLSDKLYNQQLMEKDVGDRDYHTQQGSPYLESIRAESSKLRDEIRRDITIYSYDGFKGH